MTKSSQKDSVSNIGNNEGVMANEVKGDVNNYIINPTEAEEKRRFPSLIPKLVKALAELTIISDEEIEMKYKIDEWDLEPYKIDEKISYNNLVEYKDEIEDFSLYGQICEKAIEIIDDSNIGSKSKILNDINALYRKCKRKILRNYRDYKKENVTIIRENSDRIIDMVKNELEQRIRNSGEYYDFLEEDIEGPLIRIICYAFVECKILEKPR